MAYTTPKTWASNDILTAADMNTYVRDNMLETAAATAAAQGDLVYADAANSMGTRIAKGTAGQVLAMTGASTIGWGPYLGNMDAAEVATSETSTSTTYTDLATSGPAVTIDTGTSALVILSAKMEGGASSPVHRMGFAVTGASTIGTAEKRSLVWGDLSAAMSATMSMVVPLNGALTAGSNTFTAKYSVNAGTGTWSSRFITVLPL